MFGDILHGSLLTIFATYLCLTCKEGTANPIYQARYLFALMGLFATFCGFIYNDFTSLGTQTFGPSCYKTADFEKVAGAKYQVWAHQSKNCVYPFGFDPIWFRAQ